MTPEEGAVVQAAIYIRYCINAKTAGDPPRLGKLLDAVDALIFSCPECNAGGHVCPGDGRPIGHGDADCGQHDEAKKDPAEVYLAPWSEGKFDPDSPGCAPEECGGSRLDPCSTILRTEGQYHDGEEPRWIELSWIFVLPEDRVKMPGGTTETTVTKVLKNKFHAQVETWTDRSTGKQRDSVKGPWKHYEVKVQLEGVTKPKEWLEFDPNGPVLIWADKMRRAMVELQKIDPTGATIAERMDERMEG